MRVIAGKARSIPLITPEGNKTRPTNDRIKETLFNIIQNEVSEAVFLDLYSGSGAIGIEALSRGAKEAYFVEYSRKALACIEKNLQKTRLESQSKIIAKDVKQAIKDLEKEQISFDIIFADPPYRKEFEKATLSYLKESKILKKDSLIILESALETPVDYVDNDFYEIQKIKIYKTNKHIFLKKKFREN